MRKLIAAYIMVTILILLLCVSVLISNVSKEPTWTRTYDYLPYPSSEIAFDVIQTVDSGFALTGPSSRFVNGFSSYCWLVKTDANGIMQWNQSLGGKDDDVVYTLIQTIDGGYVLGGTTFSYGAGSGDYWLVKTDANGVAQWNQTYGGGELDNGFGLIQTADGGYALVGTTLSYGAGSEDGWLVKTDANGQVLWNRTYGGARSDIANSLIQMENGDFVLAGWKTQTSWEEADYWLVKTDANGLKQWNYTYGGSGFDIAVAVIQPSSGGLVLAGYTTSYGAGGSDGWLVKVNNNGIMEWTQTYGSKHLDRILNAIPTREGGFALVGRTDSYEAEIIDFWLIKTDATGSSPDTPDISGMVIVSLLAAELLATVVVLLYWHKQKK